MNGAENAPVDKLEIILQTKLLVNLHYNYSAAGNITRINRDYYSYDGLNRLTWAGDSTSPGTGNGTAWSYSPAGNMSSKETYLNGSSQGITSFTYDLANRLWSMGSKAYNNDASGNRVGKTDTDSWVYNFDGESRLTQVTKNGLSLLENTYDGSGMRVKDVKNGQTTYYVFMGNNPLLEYSLADGKYKYFIYAGNKMIAEETDGVVKYYHSDHLGSTRLVTDSSGAVVTSYKFKPYGEIESQSGSFNTNYGFTGKPLNTDVGLSYFGARFYDPEAGRFITMDPGKDGSNWYVYCNDNPINKIDPDGRFSKDFETFLYNSLERSIDFVCTVEGAELGALLGGVAGSPTGLGAIETSACGAALGAAAGHTLGIAIGKAARNVLEGLMKSSSNGGRSRIPDSGLVKGKLDLPKGAELIRKDSAKVNSNQFKDFIRGQGKSFKSNEWKYKMETWKLKDGTEVERHYWQNTKTGETYYHL